MVKIKSKKKKKEKRNNFKYNTYGYQTDEPTVKLEIDRQKERERGKKTSRFYVFEKLLSRCRLAFIRFTWLGSNCTWSFVAKRKKCLSVFLLASYFRVGFFFFLLLSFVFDPIPTEWTKKQLHWLSSVAILHRFRFDQKKNRKNQIYFTTMLHTILNFSLNIIQCLI